MKRSIRSFFIVFLFAAASGTVCFGQQFDVQAYKDFISAHENMTAEQVFEEYPSVLFQKEIAEQAAPVAYLDSVILKCNLTKAEQELLLDNGFLVTERLSAGHTIAVLDDVWRKDLPVFVTSDAVLHALHMSYDEILKATEKYELHALLLHALESMQGRLPDLDAKYGSISGMETSLRDADVYITLALMLLNGYTAPFYTENKAVVSDLYAMIEAESPASVALFSSTPRTFDFSQFTVRGHYEGDMTLEAYFQTFMWLGRTEFMLIKPVQQGVPEQTDEDIQRQIIDAYLIRELVRDSEAQSDLDKIDAFLTFLIGESDNVTMAHLDELQADAGIASPADFLDMNTVYQFQNILANKTYAGQRINSQILMSDPGSPEQLQPPSAFLLMGQRFILDSYIFGSIVYDKILYQGDKVRRMLPSSMDVLFALGNNASAQFLESDLEKYHYAPNLASLRYLIDGYGDDYWQSSMYTLWLNSIRALNAPESLEGLPAFMHTAAWWQQKMNTQLASWAQLRHDNLLYAKQSYSGGVSCSYPEAYVEPIPELYSWMALFGDAGEALYDQLVTADQLAEAPKYFNRFAEIMRTLAGIADRELNGMQVPASDVEFLQKMLRTAKGCGPSVPIDGWYLELFYYPNSDQNNCIVADVHTAPTDEVGNEVGWVMHAGTGLIQTGFVIAPSVHGGSTVYTGPMMSYYEHVTMGFERLTDSEWSDQVLLNAFTPPLWTNAYLADRKGNMKPEGIMLKTVTATSVAEPDAQMPEGIQLHAAYPNPAGPGAQVLIGFNIEQNTSMPVEISLYDVSGKRIKTLVQESLSYGTYFVRWNRNDDKGNRVASGVYTCKLTAPGILQTQQIAIVE